MAVIVETCFVVMHPDLPQIPAGALFMRISKLSGNIIHSFRVYLPLACIHTLEPFQFFFFFFSLTCLFFVFFFSDKSKVSVRRFLYSRSQFVQNVVVVSDFVFLINGNDDVIPSLLFTRLPCGDGRTREHR